MMSLSLSYFWKVTMFAFPSGIYISPAESRYTSLISQFIQFFKRNLNVNADCRIHKCIEWKDKLVFPCSMNLLAER